MHKELAIIAALIIVGIVVFGASPGGFLGWALPELGIIGVIVLGLAIIVFIVSI